MDRLDRAATAAEVGEMTRQVEAAMAAGAIGLSTGLDYPSAVAAPTEEILALVSAVKPAGGLYCAHHRDYFERLEAAIDEALRIGRETGVPVTLSHHQCTGAANFGKARRTFPRVLGHSSRELGLFGLEEAVRRMTSLPAGWFGFADRGVVRPGAFADLVVFDPATVKDTGTFTEPARPAAGIEVVMVNGQV